MKIAVMGAGAMGSLFGGLLAFSGEDVWLIDIRKENVDALNALGLTYEKKGKIQTIGVKATQDIASVGKADLILLMVKAYQTEKAVSDALPLQHDETVFFTLQNGPGNEETICKSVDPKNVMLGVTGQGATFLGPGHIRHAGWGKTYIGELDHRVSDRAQQIAKMFCEAEIETEVSENIHTMIWNGLVVNAGIDALAALTDMKNGELLDHPETLRVMEALVSEAAEVARKKGIALEGDPLDSTKRFAEATRENRSPIGQDVDYRQKTEVDVINGAVVREAERLGIAVPYNRMITDLIRAIEKRF
jgi:2-dehydropantoate 2-reductase